MQTYKALSAVGLHVGAVVHLSTAQANTRLHALERQGKGNTFVVRSPIQFKAGESFKVEGDMPKHLAELVEVEGKKEVQTSAPPPPPAPPAPAPAPAPSIGTP